MAKKQQNQPTSTTETNLTPKGMIKDSDASYMSKQNWNHARNAINNSIDGDVGVIGNEPANLECIQIPYTIIGGIHLYGDVWAIYSTDNINSEIGKFDDSRCEYETIVNDGCLNFSTDHLITGVAKENYNCQWQVYWDDGLNPSRTLNLDDVPYKPVLPITDPCDVQYTTDLDCDKIRLAPYMDVPCIKITKAEEGGSLVNGTYQAFIAYTLDNQVIGDYVGVSNLQSVWDHSGPSGSLDINISNLDKDFDTFQLVIRYKTHNAIQSKIVGYYSTEQSTINIDYLDGRLETINDLAIIVRNPVYEKSDGMYVVNDYLIRKGPTEKFDFNYQPLANQIHTHWESWRYPATYYSNGGNKPSFMRDEQYAFFIRWIYDTGDKSKAYHIPGRPTHLVDTQFPGASTGTLFADNNLTVTGIEIAPSGSTEPYFAGVNTANIVNSADEGDLKDAKFSGYKMKEGHMGYWESTELYPHDPVRWNSNTGNSDFDLCGKPIRHHKFPDETLLNYYGDDSTLLSPTIDGQTGNWINILGVKFDNILPPVNDPHLPLGQQTVIPGIVGYEILTGNRSGNKSIIAKGIIRNMFTYERDSTTGGLNDTNGPRQNGLSFGVFPNYPYNDLHTDPYLINRNRGQLISNRPWFAGIEDNFLVDPSKHASQDNRGLNEITRDYFTFHSPDTMFSRMFLNPNEIKIYKTVRGKQLGNFKRSEEHPRFKLIKKRAVFIAAIVGVGYAINQMRGPEDFSIRGAGQNPSGEVGAQAVGTGTHASPAPGLGNVLSLTNSLFHLAGMIVTYPAKLALSTILDGATVLGMGRDTRGWAMPAFNLTESAAAGLTGAAEGSEKTMTFRGTDFTGVPRLMAMITGIFAFLNYVATGGDKILDLIRNLVSYQDHVYKYISHGFYDDEVIPLPLNWTGPAPTSGIMPASNDSAWRRTVEDARYIRQAFSGFPNNVMVNNLRRQSTVVLNTRDKTVQGTTGPGGGMVNSDYGGLLDPNGNDFSKFTIGDGMCNDCQQVEGAGTVTWYSPGVTTCKPIAANYVGLKVNIDNQYGQIDNILMQPAGECNYVSNMVPGQALPGWSEVHWGGDVYINRYTEKTSMPFFWDYLKDGEPDGVAWDYKNYPNVPYPRYWLDSNKFRMDEYIKPITDLSFDWTGHTPGDLYHLDGPSASITCEGGSSIFSGSGNYGGDGSIIGGAVAAYDTTDESLIATTATFTINGATERIATSWVQGAWTIPEDGTGVDCACNDCTPVGSISPFTGNPGYCTTPCGPACLNQDQNKFATLAAADNAFTSILAGAAFLNTITPAPPNLGAYEIYQATTDNNIDTKWTQNGTTLGTGGEAPLLPTVMPNIPNFRWHQNYSVIMLEGDITITIPINSGADRTVTFQGMSDIVTITHPDDATDVRDVQGVFNGTYDLSLFTSGGANLTGPLNDKQFFRVNNSAGTNWSYTSSCNGSCSGATPTTVPFGCQEYGQSQDDTDGAEQPGYTAASVTYEARILRVAALYDWNSGTFVRVVDDRHSYVQAYSNTVTPNPIPSGDPTDVTATGSRLLPDQFGDRVVIAHGGFTRSYLCGNGPFGTPVIRQHVINSGAATIGNEGVFGYAGGNYVGQPPIDITVVGGTPPPDISGGGTDLDPVDPPYDPATDTDNSGGVFVVTDHYMYVHNNGVQDFFVESEVNTAFRDYSDSIVTRHYDYQEYTDINTMFDAKIQDIDNYYKYDKSLSQKRFWNTTFGEIQPRWYDPEIAETCLTHYPKRLIYSLPIGGVTLKSLKQQKKEANKDFWRIFLSKNYRDFKAQVNVIKPINKTGALILFPTLSPQMFQGVDALKMDKNGSKLIIGDGGLFSQAFQNVANSDLSHEYGSCESARSVINTPMGMFYISQAQGKIFQYASKGLTPISDQGMKWWFAKYLPSRLINAIPSVEDCPNVSDNPVSGIGTQTVYDPVNDIVYFTKKDYEPLSDCICYEPCEGFYIDNNCLNGSGSGTSCDGGGTVSGTCNDPNAIFNPVTMLCEISSWAPCDDTSTICPAGPFGPTVNSCRCCADDSPSGFGNPNVSDPTGVLPGKGCAYLHTEQPLSVSVPDISPVDLGDPDFFNDVSWTVSYDPKSKAWISFHDWHPDLTFNSINHFLTSKFSGEDCPPGYVYDEDEKECCKTIEITVPRLSNLNTQLITGGAGAGTPSCIDAIDPTTGQTCPMGFDLILPCGQNAHNNYGFSLCGQTNCHCNGTGSNQSLMSFAQMCEQTGTMTTSDDGTPCATPDEIFQYEYNADGSPNGLTYVDPGFCNATCKECTPPTESTGIWRHNTRTDLYANYYGIDYPWEVDLIQHSGQSVTTIRSLEYQLESYVYQNEGRDRFHDLDWNFDEAIIYNTEQVSGLLRLNITPKNNPVLASTFPSIGGGFIDILYSKEEQKYRFNQFWDITNDRGEFSAAQQTIFNTYWTRKVLCRTIKEFCIT